MSNRKDLKAFVRYDATGRVIAGSLILQRTKPKVGDWQEIDAYECCLPTTTIAPTTTSTTTTAIQYSIGDFALGGVIAYILEEGDPGYDADVQHGLVVNISYEYNGKIPAPGGWGCAGSPITGANGTAIGTGPQNTLDIIAECSDPDTAAYICVNLSFYGYDEGYADWYLPSNGELTKIWENISLSNLEVGVGKYIWSSTEYNASEAYVLQNNGDATSVASAFNKSPDSNIFIWVTRSF